MSPTTNFSFQMFHAISGTATPAQPHQSNLRKQCENPIIQSSQVTPDTPDLKSSTPNNSNRRNNFQPILGQKFFCCGAKVVLWYLHVYKMKAVKELINDLSSNLHKIYFSSRLNHLRRVSFSTKRHQIRNVRVL